MTMRAVSEPELRYMIRVFEDIVFEIYLKDGGTFIAIPENLRIWERD